MKTPARTANQLQLLLLKRGVAVFALTCSIGAKGQVSAQTCGPLANGFGPFDYRADHYKPPPGDSQPHKEKLRMVENFHYTQPVELGVGGSRIGAGTLWGDLDYTLRAFPNHHRALVTVLRWWERNKLPVPAGSTYPVECYFERGVRFQPNDTIVRLIYARFLLQGNRKPEAVAHLEAALRDAGENGFTYFNIGLVYAEAGLYEQALTQAHRAMELGLTRRELAARLEAAGQWKEPAATAPIGGAAQSQLKKDSVPP